MKGGLYLGSRVIWETLWRFRVWGFRSKFLKGSYIGDHIGDYYKGY